jgi:hypothetical protein
MAWESVLNPERALSCAHSGRLTYYHGMLGYEAMICSACGTHIPIGITAEKLKALAEGGK